MNGPRIALLVVGIISLVVALVIMASGVGLMWVSQTLKSDSPAFASRDTRLRKADAHAIVTEAFQIDWYDESQDKGWGLSSFVTARVEVERQDSPEGVFIGIAREADVDEYLSGVRYCEIAEWNSNPFVDAEVGYRLHSGSRSPSDPTAEAFWEASAHGTGRQALDWKPDIGRWVLVFMNEDASAGIDLKVALGAKLPWLFQLGVGLVALGGLMLAAGVLMIYFAAKRSRSPLAPVQAKT